MEQKFKMFMQQYFHKCGDCCPKYRWDMFIKKTFQPYEQQKANDYTRELLKKEYICICSRDIDECYKITLLGFEKLLERQLVI